MCGACDRCEHSCVADCCLRDCRVCRQQLQQKEMQRIQLSQQLRRSQKATQHLRKAQDLQPFRDVNLPDTPPRSYASTFCDGDSSAVGLVRPRAKLLPCA